jgi:hypothetical protein
LEAEQAMEFELRFSPAEVGYWADRYQYADDAGIIRGIPEASARAS